MNRRRLLVGYWILLVLAGAAGQALLLANHRTWTLALDPVGIGTIFAITYGSAGTLILVRRPGNPIGRLFLYITTVAVLTELSSEYAAFAYLTAPGATLPLRALAAWLSGWTFFAMFPAGLSVVFLMFPDGVGPGRWRRALLGTSVVAAFVLTASYLLAAMPVSVGDRIGSLTLPVDNPTGALSSDTAGNIALVAWGVSGLVLVASVVSAVVRLRRSQGERRQQMRWLAYFAAPVAPAFAAHFVITTAGLPIPDPVVLAYLVFLVGIPVATAIALIKHRLYDLDIVVSRALVYGSLAVFITVVYVGIAVGIGALIGSGGKPNLGLSIVATAIVAIGFQPVRERVQKVANRLVYGKRATPYEVLAQFSERVAESYSVDEVMPRMARVLAEGTGAQRADVWLRSGSTWHEAAVWPEDAVTAREAPALHGNLPPANDVSRMVEVRHQGDLLGALSVTKRPGEQLTPVEENLLADLAGQAGLVLRNVGLTSDLQARLVELRASRQRLVTAQDEERRKLERNLHDGAQQHLVALKVKLGLAEMLLGRDVERAKATIDQLKGDADEALETLRDLARGIYPPLLAEKGLVVALESQARKATLPVAVEAESVARYPQDVEAAVYFCCLEALQNVQKYARASRAVVRLRGDGHRLHFEVEDDGAGFETSTARRGSGLTNMVDRLDALEGEVAVTSTLGQGARLRGSLPVERLVSSAV